MGDAEKVLALIDDYDKGLSDNSNEIEAFVHSYLIFEGLKKEFPHILCGIHHLRLIHTALCFKSMQLEF